MPYPQKIDPDRLGSVTLAVIEEEGWESWSLRDVAAALGVAPTALYRHVDDRDGLVVEAGAEAARALGAAIAALGRFRKPDNRVVAMAHAYVAFASARPGAYDAFVHAKPAIDNPAIMAWNDVWAVVVTAVAAAVPDSAEAAAFALWSMLHGRVDLTRGPTARVDAATGLEDAVRALLEGFRSRKPVASPLPAVTAG